MTQLKNHEIFEYELARHKWRRLVTTELPPLTSILDDYLELSRQWTENFRIRYPKLPATYVDYFALQSVQAFAFETQNRGFIGISGGAAGLLFLVFRRLLSDGRVMPNVGNIRSENTDLPVLVGEPVALFNIYSDMNAWVEPRDHSRNIVASILIQTAFNFLVAHEYAHITQGHCLYCEDRMGSAFMFEVDGDKSDGIDHLTSQAMEIDADTQATFQGLGAMLDRIEHPKTVNEPYQPFYRDPSESLYWWLFAVFTLFRLFVTRPLDLGNLSRGDHPHYRVRQRNILNQSAGYLGEECPQLSTKFWPIAERVLVDAETAYSQITGTEIKKEELNAAYSDPRIIDHAQEIFRRLDKIRPELDAAIRHRLPPAIS